MRKKKKGRRRNERQHAAGFAVVDRYWHVDMAVRVSGDSRADRGIVMKPTRNVEPPQCGHEGCTQPAMVQCPLCAACWMMAQGWNGESYDEIPFSEPVSDAHWDDAIEKSA